MSPEARQRIAERMRANNPMKRPEVAEKVAKKRRGVKMCAMSEAHRAAIRLANCDHLKRLAERNRGNRYGVGNTNRLGTIHTVEAKAKMRFAAARRIQRDMNKRDTTPELVVKAWLDKRGVEYEQQFRIPGERFVFDFAIPSRRILIEVDGCYWHGCERCGLKGHPENRINDALKNELAKSVGWKLLRVKECSIGL